jgi:hypothetical protein
VDFLNQFIRICQRYEGHTDETTESLSGEITQKKQILLMEISSTSY